MVDDEDDASQFCAPTTLQQFGVRGPLRYVYVPKYVPASKAQYHVWKDVWPLALASVYNPSAVPVVSLPDDDVSNMLRFMNEAIIEARREPLRGGVGAVLVNPETNEIVARAHDLSRMIDPVTGVVRASPRAPLQHAPMAVLAEWGRACCAVRDAGRAPHYLCRGFDLYVTLEPCVMCAMALLHSRVRRVVFGARNAQYGGLGSRVRVHQQASLNHRYAVYGGCLRHECEELLPPRGHGTCVGHSFNAVAPPLVGAKNS